MQGQARACLALDHADAPAVTRVQRLVRSSDRRAWGLLSFRRAWSHSQPRLQMKNHHLTRLPLTTRCLTHPSSSEASPSLGRVGRSSLAPLARSPAHPALALVAGAEARLRRAQLGDKYTSRSVRVRVQFTEPLSSAAQPGRCAAPVQPSPALAHGFPTGARSTARLRTHSLGARAASLVS